MKNMKNMKKLTVYTLFAAMMTFFMSASHAATGGPDDFGYHFIDSDEPSGPTYDFEDITETGTRLFLSDDQMSGAIAMGFTFNFYGINYTNAYIGSNGFLSFLSGQTNGCCSGQQIPSTGNPEAIIAAWWEDLNPARAGTMHTQTLGSAPNRRFIVQITDVPFFSSNAPVTHQYKLFESSGNIEVHYAVQPSEADHSVGIENEDGTIGLQYAFHTPISTPLAVLYTTNNFETALYSSDSGSIRISGVKCDSHSERNLDASLFFEYNIGPNAGTWESDFFNGNHDEDSDWEDDSDSDDGDSDNGIFTTFDSMEAKSMSHSWYDYMDLEYLLSDFGYENCDNFGDSFRHGETVVQTFIANINKRRSTADVRMRGSAFWNEDTAQGRLRRILFDYRARMNLEEDL